MAETPSVFLGMLRSELDAPEDSHEEIEEALNLIGHIVDAWEKYEISKEKIAEMLTQAIWVDGEGTLYTIGATTRRWYSKTNVDSQWKVCNTPSLTEEADKIGFATTNRNLAVIVSEEKYK